MIQKISQNFEFVILQPTFPIANQHAVGNEIDLKVTDRCGSLIAIGGGKVAFFGGVPPKCYSSKAECACQVGAPC